MYDRGLGLGCDSEIMCMLLLLPEDLGLTPTVSEECRCHPTEQRLQSWWFHTPMCVSPARFPGPNRRRGQPAAICLSSVPGELAPSLDQGPFEALDAVLSSPPGIQTLQAELVKYMCF